ncbi:hypothetical protein CMZ82_13760 [Lysobacteraceae bacterium NML93-0792]|nr:hypothetical protein CMZ82_13760 [Xanthomonadaceae bacterium NML93-0792]PBS15729.1 hypothetical protein CMZ81_08935 [Xanthomonadaceae bacterium NML93-0793]
MPGHDTRDRRRASTLRQLGGQLRVRGDVGEDAAERALDIAHLELQQAVHAGRQRQTLTLGGGQPRLPVQADQGRQPAMITRPRQMPTLRIARADARRRCLQ